MSTMLLILVLLIVHSNANDNCGAHATACDCVDPCGWDSDTDTCTADSTTTCAECSTISDDCIGGTCLKDAAGDALEATCPTAIDTNRVCQCNADCATYENCCDDVSECSGSRGLVIGMVVAMAFLAYY